MATEKSTLESTCCTDEKVFATLRILSVNDKRMEKSFFLTKGRTLLGRNQDQCDLHLPFDNLSKQHCSILIDNHEHFIMDLDSRNKTYRRTHRLTPNVYYELTNEIKLTLADVECCYYIGEVIGEVIGEPSTAEIPDITQSKHDMNSDTPISTNLSVATHTMNETREIRPDGDDDGSSSTSTRTPSPHLHSANGEGDYHRQQLINDDLPPPEDKEGDLECCSPPLLAQTGDITTSPLFDGNDVKGSIDDNDDDDQTLPFEGDSILPCDTTHKGSEPEKKLTEPTTFTSKIEESKGAPPMGQVIEPTVAYEMETDESEGAPPMGKVIEPTVAYEMETDESEGALPMGKVIEPTVAYEMEEDMALVKVEHNIGPNDKQELESSMKDEDTRGDVKEDINPSPVTMDKTDETHNDEVKPTRKTTKKGLPKKKATKKLSTRNGRNRRKPTSNNAPDRDMDENDKNSIESDSSTAIIKRRGRKRQLMEDSDDHDRVLASDDLNEKAHDSKTELGAKKKKIDEQEVVDKSNSTVKTHHKLADVSDESPDIPTLSVTTEHNQDVTPAVDVPTVEENLSCTKPRRGQKRKIPAKSANDKKDKEEISAEPKHGTRSNKKSKKLVSESEETKTDSIIEDKKIDLSSESTNKPNHIDSEVKMVNVSVQKVKGKLVGSCKDNPRTEDVRVMFTGVSDTEGTSIVQNLGGKMVDSVFQCTHLVTDKVRRTVKFLCCLSQGCTIVSTSWLNKCEAEGRFIPCEAFVIKDKTNERMYKFTLKESIAKARSSPLLQGWSVFVSPNVKPSPKEMSDIIQCAGGQVLKECPCSNANDNQLIISCEEDLGSIKKAIDNGVTVCSSEVILTGVLRQQLQTDLYKVQNRSGSKRRR